MSSDPSVALVPGTTQWQVFYRGADGNLKTQWGNFESWIYETDMGGQLFGPTCTDVTNDSCYGSYATPVVIQLPGSNDLEVFYRGLDNTLRARVRDDAGNWWPEQDLGGQMSSDPSVAPVPGTNQIGDGNYQIEVFYRGAGTADGSLMTQRGSLAFWNYETQIYGNGQLLGYYCVNSAPGGCLQYGASYSVPKAYAVGNILWIFYRGVDSTIWTQAKTGPYDSNGGWQAPYSLGGQPVGDIAGVQIPGTNTVQIFYVEPACSGCGGGFWRANGTRTSPSSSPSALWLSTINR